MAFHKTNLGMFGQNIQSDVNGMVPDAETNAWELTYDHGSESTHDEYGEITEYGEYWEEYRFPEIQAEAIAATEIANARLIEWQSE